jgi:hypothetical protein
LFVCLSLLVSACSLDKSSKAGSKASRSARITEVEGEEPKKDDEREKKGEMSSPHTSFCDKHKWCSVPRDTWGTITSDREIGKVGGLSVTPKRLAVGTVAILGTFAVEGGGVWWLGHKKGWWKKSSTKPPPHGDADKGGNKDKKGKVTGTGTDKVDEKKRNLAPPPQVVDDNNANVNNASNSNTDATTANSSSDINKNADVGNVNNADKSNANADNADSNSDGNSNTVESQSQQPSQLPTSSSSSSASSPSDSASPSLTTISSSGDEGGSKNNENGGGTGTVGEGGVPQGGGGGTGTDKNGKDDGAGEEGKEKEKELELEKDEEETKQKIAKEKDGGEGGDKDKSDDESSGKGADIEKLREGGAGDAGSGGGNNNVGNIDTNAVNNNGDDEEWKKALREAQDAQKKLVETIAARLVTEVAEVAEIAEEELTEWMEEKQVDSLKWMEVGMDDFCERAVKLLQKVGDNLDNVKKRRAGWAEEEKSWETLTEEERLRIIKELAKEAAETAEGDKVKREREEIVAETAALEEQEMELPKSLMQTLKDVVGKLMDALVAKTKKKAITDYKITSLKLMDLEVLKATVNLMKPALFRSQLRATGIMINELGVTRFWERDEDVDVGYRVEWVWLERLQLKKRFTYLTPI